MEKVSPCVPRVQSVFAGGNLGDLEKMCEKKGLYDSTRCAEGNPESLYERKEARARLRAAIARLPRRCRRVIELYYHRELTMKQIGRILRVHESRVSQLHTAAIQRLRNDPALRDGKPSPGSFQAPCEAIAGRCLPVAQSIG